MSTGVCHGIRWVRRIVRSGSLQETTRHQPTPHFSCLTNLRRKNTSKPIPRSPLHAQPAHGVRESRLVFDVQFAVSDYGNSQTNSTFSHSWNLSRAQSKHNPLNISREMTMREMLEGDRLMTYLPVSESSHGLIGMVEKIWLHSNMTRTAPHFT